MDIVRKIVAAYLVLTGIVVAVHLAVTPLYHDGSPDYPVWEIVNYFMAVGVVIVLIVGIARKRAIDGEEVDTHHLLEDILRVLRRDSVGESVFLAVVLAAEP